MYIGCKFLKSFLLLQKCHKANQLRYQVSHIFSIASDSITIIIFATNLGVNGSESDLLSWATT